MKVKEELISFLANGVLKHIDFGISRENLQKILGNTNWIHFTNNTDNYPSIYKYSRLEFYFENDSSNAELSGIMYQPRTKPGSKGNLELEHRRWNARLDIDSAMKILGKNKVLFQEAPSTSSPEVRILKTEKEVIIFFDCQNNPDKYVLNKIGKFIK